MRFCLATLSVSFAVLVSAAPTKTKLMIGPTDIGGVVNGAKGPEAGVWVIAETDDLLRKRPLGVRK